MIVQIKDYNIEGEKRVVEIVITSQGEAPGKVAQSYKDLRKDLEEGDKKRQS